jgi:mycoredoxin
MTSIIFYGASWCADCKRSQTYLDGQSVQYEYIDIDTVPGAADKVSEINKGFKSIPTIVFPNGTILVEPTDKQLAEQLT